MASSYKPKRRRKADCQSYNHSEVEVLVDLTLDDRGEEDLYGAQVPPPLPPPSALSVLDVAPVLYFCRHLDHSAASWLVRGWTQFVF